VIAQTQLLFFSALAFTLLLLSGIYPAEIRSVNIDADWFYRKGSRLFYTIADKAGNSLNSWGDRVLVKRIPGLLIRFFAEPGANIQKYGLRLLADAAGGDADLNGREIRIEHRSRLGAYPIGIWVLLAVLFLAAMSLLFFL
jgi:multicomponent Na+:H+ antiporter subunit D